MRVTPVCQPGVPVCALLLLLAAGCSGPALRTDTELRYWLENMRHHRYSPQEAAAATGLGIARARRLLEASAVRSGTGPGRDGGGRIRVLPYPGGRHPRIGFLEGAIDPQRDTKVSVFCPWEDGGYVVVDLPEAMWRDGAEKPELMYLAHTHIPTVWDRTHTRLPPLDWVRKPAGILESSRKLPDAVEFSARVVPGKEFVDMELRLKNGSQAALSGLRTQICVMLKGAPDFNAQTLDNKIKTGWLMATGSADSRRWVLTVWQRARPWGNKKVPCMHSDPVFPDLAPGEEARLRGRLWFYQGDDSKAEVERQLEAWKKSVSG